MATIERLHKTGIVREGKPEKGFKYFRADGRRVSSQELERISSLRIPPAWTDVAISAANNGRLQAVGKDAAGRWQYLYHENHIRKREVKKFQRLVEFAEALPKMRARISRHLTSEN